MFRLLVAVVLLLCLHAAGQNSNQSQVAGNYALGDGIPMLIKFTGTNLDSEGRGVPGLAGITFALYDSATSVVPLWVETLNVTADESGHFSAILGSSKKEGLPPDLFANAQAHWIGFQLNQAGAKEQPRTLLLSVPYALKAQDAQLLGGRPASDYVIAPTANQDSTKDSRGALREQTAPVSNGSSNGISGFISKFDSASTVVDSTIFETNVGVGVGTTTPNGNFAVESASEYGIVVGQNNGTNARHLLFGYNTVQNYAAISSVEEGIAYRNLILNLDGGNVGIGTKTPLTKLQVNGNIANTGSIGVGTTLPAAALGIENGSPYGGIAVGQNAGSNPKQLLVGYDTNSNYASFSALQQGVGYTSIALQPDGGNVGVGLKNPNAKFHVNGNIVANGSLGINTTTPGALLGIESGSSAAILIGQNAGANPKQLLIGYDTTSNLASFTAVQQGVGYTTIALQPNGGNVGVGVLSPIAKLDVSQHAGGSGSFSIGTPPPAAIHGDVTTTSGFVSGVFGTTSSPDGFGVLGENLASGSGTGHSAGVRGITANTSTLGTGVWGDALQTSGDNVGVFGHSASTAGTGVEGFADSATGDAVGVYGRSDSSSGAGVFGEATAGTAVANGSLILAGVYGRIAANGGAAGLFDTAGTGDILIGRAGGSPVNKFRVDSTGKMFANGGTATSGADFAESVSILNERSNYEAGDVMAIDTTGVRRFTMVSKPYSTLVAGIYSTKPGVLATPHAADDPRHETEEIPLAIVGIVPCKVSSENGAINAGDLLVSSSTSGYAMKGTDRTRMTGAVIGKALQAMHGTNGVIEVLVSLQ